jgi:DNA polymerase-3 subunit epsilon
MLRDKPKFADVVAEFVEFASGAQWIIHNAPFDVAFLDEEFTKISHRPVTHIATEVLDTLALAREHFPGKRNSLDALCERLGVANAHRTLHGALLDAQLLAEVYLAMTRGQETLTIDMAPSTAFSSSLDGVIGAALHLRVLQPLAEEMTAHEAYLLQLDRDSKGACVWLSFLAPPAFAEAAA